MTHFPKDYLTREGIITNMCYTWDHSFGLELDPNPDNVINNMGVLTYEEKISLWRKMAQIFDNDIAPHVTLKFDKD